MSVRVEKGGSRHAGAMLAALFKLLTIASFLMMPLGMSSAPASAAEHHAATASMPCDGHEQPTKAAPDGKTHCTSCVAIAEPHGAAPAADIQPALVLVDRTGQLLFGLEPEVATPPPKRV